MVAVETPSQWVSTIIERILRYRNPEGVKIGAWGQNADAIGLTLLARDPKKIWLFHAHGSDGQAHSAIPFVDPKGCFQEKRSTEDFHLYVQLDCNLNKGPDWFHEIPMGALVVCVWDIKNENELEDIRSRLELNQPLWSQSVRTFDGVMKGLLAFSKATGRRSQ